MRVHVVPLIGICLALLFGLFINSALSVEYLVWESDAYSSGVPVVSPVLDSGFRYRIVVSLTWWYDYDGNLAADAMYYTTDWTNNIFWGNHFPAPDGHSFLQIDGQDINWGAFSNGDTNHTYTIMRMGQDAALTFTIVDWIDGNYTNNISHIHILIYREVTVGGTIADGSSQLFTYVATCTLIAACAIGIPLAKRQNLKVTS